MRINSAIEFFHFARGNGFSNISPEVSALIQCIEEFGRMCPCDPQATRDAKMGHCKALYSGFLLRAPQFKDALLSKVSDNVLILCADGQVITTINR